MPVVRELKQHKILLDTHVWIWVAEGNPILPPSTRKAIERAKELEHLLISPISIWEISMLVERKRILLDMDMTDWLKQWVELPGILVAEFSFQVALLSNRLPGIQHSDPADRILIASAYEENAVLVTADEKILKYGKDHFISVYDPT
ncbi:MAG: type II toxin-antitoxin system VapC family toxin [Verrucomicrobiota bacterium]|nr:type II toxin-antitoxin system VapC family toxin [Verrucomicrobiota bacterium]